MPSISGSSENKYVCWTIWSLFRLADEKIVTFLTFGQMSRFYFYMTKLKQNRRYSDYFYHQLKVHNKPAELLC